MKPQKKSAKKAAALARREKAPASALPPVKHALLGDLRGLILGAREGVARMLDTTLTLLYWEVGHRIRTEVLQDKRANYGAKIVVTLSRHLEVEFGSAFEEKNLRRMAQFAEIFPDREIVAALSRQLSWSHFLRILPLKDDIKRDFYAEMCRMEKWNTTPAGHGKGRNPRLRLLDRDTTQGATPAEAPRSRPPGTRPAGNKPPGAGRNLILLI